MSQQAMQPKPIWETHDRDDCPRDDQPSFNIKLASRGRESNAWGGTAQVRECRTCGNRWVR